MKRSSRDTLISLHLIPGIGARRIWELKNYLGTLDNIWNLSLQDLTNVPGIGLITAKKIIRAIHKVDPEKEKSWAKKNGFNMCVYGDLDYPSTLRMIEAPPPVLYYCGKLPQEVGVSIVGTRRPSIQGQKQAFSFASQLAKLNIPIISGLAFGIDEQAHKGALAAGGETIAVIGSPLDSIYPQDNYALAKKIVKTGCLISEFSSISPIVPGNFPQRNRIISALSHGVLVIEAPKRSGALITANWAVEQGKDVWAIPGDINQQSRKGNHELIKDGAGLVDQVDDILISMGKNLSIKSNTKESLTRDIISYYQQGCGLDDIVALTNISPAELQRKITTLKLKGVIT